MITRIKLNRLAFENGSYSLDGEAFSGVAYRVEAGKVLGNFVINDGVKGEPEERWDVGVARVDFAVLEEKDETDPLLYLDDSPYNGFAFEFDSDTGALLSVFEHDETGNNGRGKEWFESGKLSGEFGRQRPDGKRESEAWYENGKRASLSCPSLSARLTEEGKLRYISLETPPPVEDIKRLELDADAMLSLAGAGIDDAFLAQVKGLGATEKLSIRGTNLTTKGLQVFANSESLKSIDTAQNSGFSGADVQEIVGTIRNCQWVDRDTALKKLSKK